MAYIFDGETKVITLTAGTTSFDVADLYSRWKEWVLLSDNSKFAPAMRSVGGDPISNVKNLGATYFIINGWRIRPQEANHRLIVNGNLYTDPPGDSPILGTLGTYSVVVEMNVSNLVDSTLAQITEIEYAAFGDEITIDTVAGAAGTEYPIGAQFSPVNNLADAKTIATSRGFDKFRIIGSLTIGATDNITALYFRGQGATLNVFRTTITLTQGCVTTNAHYTECKVTGYQGGESIYENCIIDGIDNAHCHYEFCGLLDGTSRGYTIRQSTGVGTTHATYMKDCYSDEGTAIIDRNGAKANMQIDGFVGAIKFINQNRAYVSSSDRSGTVWIHLNGGTITIDPSCTTGEIYISGHGRLINQSGGTKVDTQAFVSEGFSSMKLSIESLRQTHQGFGSRFYVDSVSGNDNNDGLSIGAPVKTVTKAIQNATSGNGDVIYLLAPSAGAVTINERVVVNKEDIHIRGPGRGVQFQPSTTNLGPVIDITANNCSLAGFIVRAPSGSTTDDCIRVSGKFSRMEKLYVVGAGQGVGTGHGIVYESGDYHELIDCESEKCGGAGIHIHDHAYANGSPREISIKRGNFYLNGRSGIEFVGQGTVGSSTRLNRILGANCHDNLRYGIEIDALSSGTVIDSATMLHNNTLGTISDLGLATYHQVGGGADPSVIADAVWTSNSSSYNTPGTMGNVVSQTTGLTPEQTTMMLEMYRLMGLDPTRPLVVTQTSRVAGNISQSIDSTSTTTTVTRI
jgi:hypothetical protein